MKYLLDTNVISEVVRSVPNRHVMALIERHQDVIATASPVWHELQYGCQRLPLSRKRELIEVFIETVIRPNMVILPYDERAAGWHARERVRLTAQGQTPPYVDSQIAAIARVNGLVLVTRNTSDFEMFSDLEVQNWHRPI